MIEMGKNWHCPQFSADSHYENVVCEDLITSNYRSSLAGLCHSKIANTKPVASLRCPFNLSFLIFSEVLLGARSLLRSSPVTQGGCVSLKVR